MKKVMFLISLMYSVQTFSQGTIMTVAGTGVSGFSGDGGDAKLAQVSKLYGSSVVIGASGDIYFIDCDNYRIRKINAKTGVISTWAGTGGRGYSGDGGPSTLAEIGKPWSMTLDWKGNLLFIDTGYCRIRSISPAGIINYLGGSICGYDGDGGPIATAKFGATDMLLGADSGAFYISSGSRIRRSDKFGVVNRVVGSVSSGFTGDGGLAIYAMLGASGGITLNPLNYLTISDGGATRRIRQINEKGIINTIAGNGGGTPAGDGGKAIAASLGTLGGIAYDQFGNLFIATSFRIRRIDAKDSIITTIAGTGVNAYSGEGVDAKTSSIGVGYIFLDTAKYEIYFPEGARLRKITNLIKPVSISETAKTYTPEIFPIPANTKISVSGIPIRSEIWIYDLLGREQLHTTMSQIEVDVDVSGFAPGTYILRAKTPTAQEVHSKFVKQ